MLDAQDAAVVRDAMNQLFGIRVRASAIKGLNLSQVADRYLLDDKQLSELALVLFLYKLVSGHYDPEPEDEE